jgi:hypothetical protein
MASGPGALPAIGKDKQKERPLVRQEEDEPTAFLGHSCRFQQLYLL